VQWKELVLVVLSRDFCVSSIMSPVRDFGRYFLLPTYRIGCHSIFHFALSYDCDPYALGTNPFISDTKPSYCY
jgi:hypothetical protein